MTFDLTGDTSTTVPDRAVQRPSLRHFVWYSVGGSLPERYWPWVIRDTASRTWALREFVRFLAVLVPLLALYLVIGPGPVGLRWLTGMTFVGGLLLYMFINILVLNDRRAVRAGCPSGHVGELRSRRSNDSHHLAVVARNERAAARRARRNA